MRKFISCLIALVCLAPLIVNANEGTIFQNVIVKGRQGAYTVTGEVNEKLDHFYYTVEDGHVEYVRQTKVTVTQPATFKITIQIPKEKLPQNATLVMHLYQKTLNGEPTQSHPVVLDVFK